jgi:hypothetical protein
MRARVTATIEKHPDLADQRPRVVAQAEGMLGESMRFVLDSLRKQMDDAGVREIAAGNNQLRTITIKTEVL